MHGITPATCTTISSAQEMSREAEGHSPLTVLLVNFITILGAEGGMDEVATVRLFTKSYFTSSMPNIMCAALALKTAHIRTPEQVSSHLNPGACNST